MEGGRGENFFLTMACGVKGWGGQMIVKSCVSAKKSFSRLGFFLHERGSISVGTMKPRLDLKYSKVHNGSHRTGAPFPRGIFRRHMCAPFRERHHMGAATQLSDFNYL